MYSFETSAVKEYLTSRKTFSFLVSIFKMRLGNKLQQNLYKILTLRK